MRQVRGGLSAGDELLLSRFNGWVNRRVGRFAGRPHVDRWVWDRTLLDVLGYAAEPAPASLSLLLQHVPEQERALVADAFRSATEQTGSVIVSFSLRTANNQVRSVLVVVELMESEPSGLDLAMVVEVDGLAAGTGPWLAGHLIDLTELRLGAARDAADEAVAESRRHRAVIEQARGMVMLAYRIDADAAFQVLRRVSQHTNTKLRDLAIGVVAAAETLPAGRPWRDHLDEMFVDSLRRNTLEETG